MKTGTVIVLLVFAAMALGSFALMADTHGGASPCFAETIHGGACPDNNSLLALASFHTSAFGAFSLAVFSSLAVLFLLAVASLAASGDKPRTPLMSFRSAVAAAPLEFPSVLDMFRALARLEHSPTR